MIKNILNTIKNWFIGNGVEGILGLIIGIILLVMRLEFYSGLAFGVFACKNWELLKTWIMKLHAQIK